MRRWLGIICAATLLAYAGGGCGSSTRPDTAPHANEPGYALLLAQASEKANQAGARLEAAIAGKDDHELRAALANFMASRRQFAGDLGRITAPLRIQKEHRRLEAALSDELSELARIARDKVIDKGELLRASARSGYAYIQLQNAFREGAETQASP